MLALAGDLLPLFDFIGLLLAGYASTRLVAASASPVPSSGLLWSGIESLGVFAAVLAPFLLCDRGFARAVREGRTGALLRCWAIRFTMFAGVLLAIGAASGALARLPSGWAASWLVCSLAVTALARILLARHLRRLQERGRLALRIAVVGAGPLADRFIQHLRGGPPTATEVLGVFDDRADRGALCKATGNIAALVELGTRRDIDWIVLCLPSAAGLRAEAIVHRLKSLAAPIGLCPANIGSTVAGPAADGLGELLPVKRREAKPIAGAAGAPRPFAGFGALFNATPGAMFAPMRGPFLRPLGTADLGVLLREALGEFLPRWVVRLPEIPAALFARVPPARLTLSLDPHDVHSFTPVAARFGQTGLGYVVTPNADHLLRLDQDAGFRALYADAAYVLLDSRFVATIWRRLRGVDLPVCTGADLAEKLFDQVILPDDGVVLIGGSDAQAALLRQRHGLKRLAHFNPPMGFIEQPAAVAACLAHAEAHSPFRFCFLAVGSPQQEILAQALKARGKARGLVLCVGASIDFLTGKERRAPRWLQQAGFEWTFRLLQSPRRMAPRYLLRGPRLLALLGRTDIVLRSPVPAEVAVVPPPASQAGTNWPPASKRYAPSSQPCPNRISA